MHLTAHIFKTVEPICTVFRTIRRRSAPKC